MYIWIGNSLRCRWQKRVAEFVQLEAVQVHKKFTDAHLNLAVWMDLWRKKACFVLASVVEVWFVWNASWWLTHGCKWFPVQFCWKEGIAEILFCENQVAEILTILAGNLLQQEKKHVDFLIHSCLIAKDGPKNLGKETSFQSKMLLIALGNEINVKIGQFCFQKLSNSKAFPEQVFDTCTSCLFFGHFDLFLVRCVWMSFKLPLVAHFILSPRWGQQVLVISRFQLRMMFVRMNVNHIFVIFMNESCGHKLAINVNKLRCYGAYFLLEWKNKSFLNRLALAVLATKFLLNSLLEELGNKANRKSRARSFLRSLAAINWASLQTNIQCNAVNRLFSQYGSLWWNVSA